eukprot:SAG31_NODE_2825_length_5038_cov_2.170277_3_plen_110_part_00
MTQNGAYSHDCAVHIRLAMTNKIAKSSSPGQRIALRRQEGGGDLTDASAALMLAHAALDAGAKGLIVRADTLMANLQVCAADHLFTLTLSIDHTRCATQCDRPTVVGYW